MSRILNGWIWKRLERHNIQFIHRHGTIDHMGSIHVSYAWLLIENTPSQFHHMAKV
jgi:hypothetical protein